MKYELQSYICIIIGWHNRKEKKKGKKRTLNYFKILTEGRVGVVVVVATFSACFFFVGR